MIRNSETYGKWSKEVAEEEGVLYIDMNDLIAAKCEAMGKEQTTGLFKDRVHTSRDGALLFGKTLIEGIQATPDLHLNQYIKP
jgi:lysophospholipase L1-like esterase